MNIPDNWKLLKTVSHDEIKPFIKECLEVKGSYKTFYLIVMLISLSFLVGLISYFITKFIRTGEFTGSKQLLLAFAFSFTALIVIHELLHALAYKLKGANRIYFGADVKKFIFYAGSDLHLIDGKAFRIVALFPFITIALLTLSLSVLISDLALFFLTVFALHNLFCGGDFAMLNYMAQFSLDKITTFDSKKAKESYFYLTDKL
ncbi:DUF3267 domain-containing protein [Flavobacteriaceae bacterium M23B6Z8]